MVLKRRVEEPCCFLAAAIRRRETQHLEGEGQWAAIGPARVIHRGAAFGGYLLF